MADLYLTHLEPFFQDNIPLKPHIFQHLERSQAGEGACAHKNCGFLGAFKEKEVQDEH